MKLRFQSPISAGTVGTVALLSPLIGSVLLSACAPATPTPPPEPVVVKLGYLPVLAFHPYYVALENGYFEEQGIVIEFERFRSGSEMIAPLASGALDVGAGQNAPSLFNAVDQGMDIKVVAGVAAQPPGHAAVPIMARLDLYESGELDTPAELAGKTVATNVPNSIGDYLLNSILQREGLALEDVNIVTMPFPDMLAAFENNAIDAAILPSPLYGAAIGRGLATVLVPGDEVSPGVQDGVQYYGANFLSAESDLPVRFLVAYLQGVRDIQGDAWKSEENIGILSKYTELPLEVLEGLNNAYYHDANGRGNVDSILDFQDFYLERGYVEYSQALTLDEITDYSYLEEALERLGEYPD